MRRLAIENNGMFTREERVYESLAHAIRKCPCLDLLNVGHALDSYDVSLLVGPLIPSIRNAYSVLICVDVVNRLTRLKAWRARGRGS